MNGLAHAAAWERLVDARVAHVLVLLLNRADLGHRVASDDSTDFKSYATSMAVPLYYVQSVIAVQL
jgi:hypothetical protein